MVVCLVLLIARVAALVAKVWHLRRKALRTATIEVVIRVSVLLLQAWYMDMCKKRER